MLMAADTPEIPELWGILVHWPGGPAWYCGGLIGARRPWTFPDVREARMRAEETGRSRSVRAEAALVGVAPSWKARAELAGRERDALAAAMLAEWPGEGWRCVLPIGRYPGGEESEPHSGAAIYLFRDKADGVAAVIASLGVAGAAEGKGDVDAG
jgi:hypothetical protein